VDCGPARPDAGRVAAAAEGAVSAERKSGTDAPITVDRPVTLQAVNALKVTVLGDTGSSITVSVVGVDNDLP